MFVWLAHTPLKYVVYNIIAKIFSFNMAPDKLFFFFLSILSTKKRNICNWSKDMKKKKNFFQNLEIYLSCIEKYSPHV